jgi:hypothetical protein
MKVIEHVTAVYDRVSSPADEAHADVRPVSEP